jgi:hypothetical protein
MSTPNVINLAEYRKALAELRSRWGAGPWVDEPDEAEWVDPETGYLCKALRHDELGHWCGYVGVPPSHSCYGEAYDKVDVHVHAGLTFSTGSTAREAIEADAPWWFGFDCAHAGDLMPFMDSAEIKALTAKLDAEVARFLDLMATEATREIKRGRVYRTLDYVKGECTSLAAQLRNID